MNRKQKRFMQWVLTQDGEREPETLQELADEFNCRPSTLKRWYNQVEFKKALESEIRYRVELQFIRTFQVQIQKAISEGFKSLMALDKTKIPDLNSKNNDDNQKGNQGPFTYEEYQQARKNIKEWEEREFGQEDKTK